MQANASAITTENKQIAQYKTSVHEEFIIKLASTLHTWINNEWLAPWLCHVRKAGSHVTLRIRVATAS